ncbi:ATP-binding protein [Dehalogenimonas formicexedens]|uniref:ATP-binding protein n=1 Tax=Dehalogenimonas formicexedens TaxID=1839801 RepID=UPI0013142D0B|nr:ATP-binding protein [Dehalogenimonas formicexedens]
MPEERYRPRYLKEDARLTSITALFSIAITGLFAFRDYQFLGMSSEFYALAALRLGIVIMGLFIIRFLKSVDDFRAFDRVTFFGFLAGVTGFLIINATRPPDYTLYLLSDLAAAAAIYIAVPQKLSNQLFLGMYIMAGDILILIFTKDVALHSQLFTIIPTFATVNIIGFGLSRRLQASRCRETLAREAEAQAQEAKLKMELEQHRTEKLEAIGQAAGGIAHDFNNIFTAIIGNVSLARELAEPDSEMGVILAEAEKASIRATELNRQLITFARGGQPVKQPSYVVDLVRETVNSVLNGSKIEAKVSIPEVIIAEMDPAQIRQALKNILVNAKEAMPGGGTVRIDARSVDALEISRRGLSGLLNGERYILLEVSDDGPGIPEKDRDKVFQPFFSTKPGASGLGLPAAYSICKSHGGYLTISYNGSRGATFSIYLPAGITAPELPEARAGAASHFRILVMDDEQDVRKVAGKMILRIGYDVETAVDGREAIELYREGITTGNRFNAVILDMTVPGGMGGLETIGILRDIDPMVTAIVSSGYSDDPALAQYADLGFSGVIHKPYSIDQLREALDRVFGLAPAGRASI